MAPYDEVFNRLNTSDETRRLARTLHKQAAQLTKQGSGRSTGQGQNALCAICAFLASQRLGNGEVTIDQACAAACIDPKSFNSTLSSVEMVLVSSSPLRSSQSNITYTSLVKQYMIRGDAYVPMVEVENALRESGASMEGSQIGLMRYAIFYWVCSTILRVNLLDAAHLRQTLQVSTKKWTAAIRVLEKHCSHMADDLIRNADTAFAASNSRTTRSQTRAATQDRVDASPVDSPTRSYGSPTLLTPTKSTLIQSIRRKAPAETLSPEHGSPSKRTKGCIYVPSGLGQDLTTHTPNAKRGNAASLFRSQVTMGDGDESDEMSNETIIVRSDRSSRKQLDLSPWNSQGPRAAGEESGQLTPAASTHGNPSVAIISTPMTSTGMSDTSSPSSPSSPSVPIRADFRPLKATTISLPSLREEEMPRRRRRNLRAAFLDPGAYGWRPTALTAQKLEWARKWEALMIDKYGDPWNNWKMFPRGHQIA